MSIILGLDLLRRISPKFTAWIFYYLLPILLLARFLLSTIFGVLFLTIGFYLLMWQIGVQKPYTLSELLFWVDGLSAESKTSLATTIVTIIGFLIAFQTATLNWKAQSLALLKQQVAKEIDDFFSEASKLIIETQIYVNYLVEVAENIQLQDSSNEAHFSVNYALKKAPQFIATRDRLSEMSVEVHRILGRNFSVLSTAWGATKALEDCNKALVEITERMWVHIPIFLDNHPNPCAEFLAQVNVEECMAFSKCCDRNYDFINGNIGGLRGLLLSPIIGFNFSSLASLSGKKALFTEALRKIRKPSEL